MKWLSIQLVFVISLILSTIAIADSSINRFKAVADRLVSAINAENYPAIQQDFGKEMLEAFPLEKAIPFFKKLKSDCGKITRTDSARLIDASQAIVPVQFDCAMLDIKIVLDYQSKIVGLWFLPHASSTPVPQTLKTIYKLPFEGDWLVVWGGDTLSLNQHHGVPNQKFAYDFLKVDGSGKNYRNKGIKNEDYYAFGQKILAPADGEVTDVIEGVRDNVPGSMNPYSALGNAVILQHQDFEVSILAHLKQGSVRVKIGERVKQGQLIGLCGNSGNSSEPHLHYHLQNTPIVQDGIGLKVCFNGIIVKQNGKNTQSKTHCPAKSDIVYQPGND